MLIRILFVSAILAVAGGCTPVESGTPDEASATDSDGSTTSTTATPPSSSSITGDDPSTSGEPDTSTTGSTTADPSTSSTTAPPEPECGDGYVDKGEECDDGNDDNSDACLETCVAAACGDSHVQAGVEECDDGNQIPDDGCDNACVRDRLVFLTEQMFGPKNIGDLDGADLECQKVALANNRPNPTEFMAWLSNDSHSPATRFYRSPGRYVLSTGAVVADSWDDLTDGTLQHAIDRTLDGKLIADNLVWTSTKADGESWGEGKNCQNWTTPDVNESGRGGASGYSDGYWTDVGSDITCGNAASLYCFEQF